MELFNITSLYFDITVSELKYTHLSHKNKYIFKNNRTDKVIVIDHKVIPNESVLKHILREPKLFRDRAKSEDLRALGSRLVDLLGVDNYSYQSLWDQATFGILHRYGA